MRSTTSEIFFEWRDIRKRLVRADQAFVHRDIAEAMLGKCGHSAMHLLDTRREAANPCGDICAKCLLGMRHGLPRSRQIEKDGIARWIQTESILAHIPMCEDDGLVETVLCKLHACLFYALSMELERIDTPIKVRDLGLVNHRRQGTRAGRPGTMRLARAIAGGRSTADCTCKKVREATAARTGLNDVSSWRKIEFHCDKGHVGRIQDLGTMRERNSPQLRTGTQQVHEPFLVRRVKLP